jgi:hypothetical protein
MNQHGFLAVSDTVSQFERSGRRLSTVAPLIDNVAIHQFTASNFELDLRIAEELTFLGVAMPRNYCIVE